MSNGSERTVAELGESGVLGRILSQLSEAEVARLGPGDDCAVLSFEGDGVVTTDSMIEGTDFRLDWHSGFELGFKLAATNLSDVAAMGAKPTALTVALACPDTTPIALLEEIARGLDVACHELAPGCGVVGGDLSRAPVLMATVTALGELAGRAPVTRYGARAGDTIAYAGSLGLAGLGLSLLFEHDAESSRQQSEARAQVLSGDIAQDRDRSTPVEALAALRARHPAAIAAQLAPRTPIFLGVKAADAGVTAMLDVSDGLTLDAARIARASGVVLDLDPELLSRGFERQAGTEVTLEAMLYGGEDHGLLATFPEGAELPTGFVRIGIVRGRANGERSNELMLGGQPCEPRGWDPFTAL